MSISEQVLQEIERLLAKYQDAKTEEHINAGVDPADARRLEEAIAEYNEAIRLNPQLVIAYVLRADAYDKLGQL